MSSDTPLADTSQDAQSVGSVASGRPSTLFSFIELPHCTSVGEFSPDNKGDANSLSPAARFRKGLPNITTPTIRTKTSPALSRHGSAANDTAATASGAFSPKRGLTVPQSLEAELALLRSRLYHLEREVHSGHFIPYQALSNREDESMDVYITELCWFAATGNASAVAMLLRSGVSPNCHDYDSNTPLHLAARSGHTKVVDVLLRHMADPCLEDCQGRTAYTIAVEMGHADVAVALRNTQLQSIMGNFASPFSSTNTNPFGSPVYPSSTFRTSITETFPTSKFTSLTNMGAAGSETLAENQIFEGLVVVVVGLPFRGKSFIAQRVSRYFNWHGVPSKIFCMSAYKREQEAAAARAADQPDEEPRAPKRTWTIAKMLHDGHKEEYLHKICEDAYHFAFDSRGVAIIDGTNVTRARRRFVFEHIVPRASDSKRMVFVEVVSDDQTTVMKNVQVAAKMRADGDKEHEDALVRDFLELVPQYEKKYEPLDVVQDGHLSFIKLHNQRRMLLHKIEGVVLVRLAHLLMNTNPTVRPVCFTDCGEYEHLVAGRLGGDSGLTPNGEAYAKVLAEKLDAEIEEPFLVMTSTMKRAVQTCSHFKHTKAESVRALPTLSELHYGDCEDLTVPEILATLPRTYANIMQRPYYTAWPNGESIRQLILARLEHCVHDIISADSPVVVVAHKVVIQALLVYFSDVSPESAPLQKVPLNTFFRVRVDANRGTTIENVDLTDDVQAQVASQPPPSSPAQ